MALLWLTDEVRERGPWRQAQGVSPEELLLLLLPWLQVSWGLLEIRRCMPEREEGCGRAPRRENTHSFYFRKWDMEAVCVCVYDSLSSFTHSVNRIYQGQSEMVQQMHGGSHHSHVASQCDFTSAGSWVTQ